MRGRHQEEAHKRYESGGSIDVRSPEKLQHAGHQRHGGVASPPGNASGEQQMVARAWQRYVCAAEVKGCQGAGG